LAKILKWGNGRGVLLPAYATTALGLKVNTEVVISVDTDSRQIVIAPNNTANIQEQYFVKATIVAKPKPQQPW
jgi:antitoxin component of MazEF toxin-antitoxin module